MTIPTNNIPSEIPVLPTVKQDSTLAIVSLVTGILGWTILPFLGSIVAIITGHLAKKEIRESGGRLDGDGMALAGLILGYTMLGLALLGLLVLITLLVVFIPGARSETSLVLPYLAMFM